MKPVVLFFGGFYFSGPARAGTPAAMGNGGGMPCGTPYGMGCMSMGCIGGAMDGAFGPGVWICGPGCCICGPMGWPTGWPSGPAGPDGWVCGGWVCGGGAMPGGG